MVLALRALARLITLVLLVALAVAGGATALFSVQGGDDPLSLASLAGLLRLPELRDTVGAYLDQLEADGPLAKVSALAGVGVVVGSVLLLIGALAPRRERLLVLDEGGEGRIAARRRPFEQLAVAAVRDGEATEARARLRVQRGGRSGRLGLRLAHPRNEPPGTVTERASRTLAPLITPFRVEPRIEAKVAGKGARVR